MVKFKQVGKKEYIEAKGLTMEEALAIREKVNQAAKLANAKGYFFARIRARGPRTGPECEAYAKTATGRGRYVSTYAQDLPLALGKSFAVYIYENSHKYEQLAKRYEDQGIGKRNSYGWNSEASALARNAISQKYDEVISCLKNIV